MTKCKLTSGSQPDGGKVPDDFSHSCLVQNGIGGNGVNVSYGIIVNFSKLAIDV